jgi:hypothetical protein
MFGVEFDFECVVGVLVGAHERLGWSYGPGNDAGQPGGFSIEPKAGQPGLELQSRGPPLLENFGRYWDLSECQSWLKAHHLRLATRISDS